MADATKIGDLRFGPQGMQPADATALTLPNYTRGFDDGMQWAFATAAREIRATTSPAEVAAVIERFERRSRGEDA